MGSHPDRSGLVQLRPGFGREPVCPEPVALATNHRRVQQHFRISIAGVQERTALLRVGDRWHRPLGATPTTHILKLPMGAAGLPFDVSDPVENEWLCAAILRELGIPVARTEIAGFGEQKVLVVERFDRRWQGVDGNPYAPGFTPPAVPSIENTNPMADPGFLRCWKSSLGASSQPGID